MGKTIKQIEKERGLPIRAILMDLYIEKGMSTPQIGEMLGYDPGNLSRVMKQLGIPTRSYSESQKLYWALGVDTSKQLSNLVRGFNKGLEMSSEQKTKIAKSNEGKHWHRAYKLRAQPNRIERMFLDILDKHCPGKWKFSGDGSVIIGGLCPDFVNVNGKKAIIEVFGSYWHNPIRRKLRLNQTPEGRQKAFAIFGFHTLILWDYEIKELPEVELVNKIKMLEAM